MGYHFRECVQWRIDHLHLAGDVEATDLQSQAVIARRDCSPAWRHDRVPTIVKIDGLRRSDQFR
jgi:hypothetical protein